jgi:hypothetical protein
MRRRVRHVRMRILIRRRVRAAVASSERVGSEPQPLVRRRRSLRAVHVPALLAPRRCYRSRSLARSSLGAARRRRFDPPRRRRRRPRGDVEPESPPRRSQPDELSRLDFVDERPS